jgi:hypothetical protein
MNQEKRVKHSPGHGYVVRVFPSRAALNQRLQYDISQSSQGVSLRPPFYTFDSLLPAVLADLALPMGRKPLAPLAGPLLVSDLISKYREVGGAFSGMAQGRRLPDRLWRLLVEIKAAGLSAADIYKINNSEQLGALADLLEQYDHTMRSLGLEDQADLLSRAEANICQGRRLPIMRNWASLEAHGVLWLRSLDLRLLRMLSRLIPVTVRFCITPTADDPLFKLCRYTADYLEETSDNPAKAEQGGLRLVWENLSDEEDSQSPGPLAELAQKMLSQLGGDYGDASQLPLELIRESGRYSEVEALVQKARDLVAKEVAPDDIALLFPDISLYGQMVRDVAQRIGLPLERAAGVPLIESPLVAALLSLFELGLGDMPAGQVARVFDSPYLSEALARWLLGEKAKPFSGIARLLRIAGYIDNRESNALDNIKATADKYPYLSDNLNYIADAIHCFKTRLGIEQPKISLPRFIQRISRVLSELSTEGSLFFKNPPDIKDDYLPSAERLQVRDLMALAAFKNCLDDLAKAGEQISSNTKMSPARLLSLLRQVVSRVQLSQGRSAKGGVRLMPLQDAHGLKLHYAFIGGLTQGGFPIPPQSQHLIGSHERMQLGRLAKMPVWRTEDEEYSGQSMRLAWLLSRLQGRAVLSCPASGFDGKEEEPAFVFSDLARGLGIRLEPPLGGAFGALPPLDKCRDATSFWAAMARDLLIPTPGQDRADLATQVLHRIEQSEQVDTWHSLAHRSRIERRRDKLDHMPISLRPSESGVYSGRISTPQALDILRHILAQPGMTTLSPSSLETMALCPMYWFFSRILGLAEPETPAWEIGGREEGIWVHESLARFFAPPFNPNVLNEESIQLFLDKCISQARDQLLAKGGKGHPSLWQAREQVVRAALRQVVASELEQLGECLPQAVEAEFGGESDPLRIPLDDGGSLSLRGRLDRLDACPGQLRITDYKHTKNSMLLRHAVDQDSLGITAFQLPIYLAAAKNTMGAQKELVARLVPTKLTKRRAGVLQYNNDDVFLAPLESPGQYPPDTNLFAAIADLWQQRKAGDFTPHPDKLTCEYCELQGLCRARLIEGLEAEA